MLLKRNAVLVAVHMYIVQYALVPAENYMQCNYNAWAMRAWQANDPPLLTFSNSEASEVHRQQNNFKGEGAKVV